MKVFLTYKSKGNINTLEKIEKITEFLEKKRCIINNKDIRNKNANYLGDKMLDKEILNRNLELIKDADVLIAEITNPSLGVGYQINFAKNLNKKVICLYENQVKQELSPIINGDEDLIIIKYSELKELIDKLSEKI